MIGISKLYCGTVEPSDALRYGRDSSRLPSHLLQFSKDKRPVVVWNVTRRCNLKCVHCYAHAKNVSFENELTTEQGKDLIDDLASFGSPVMLFSGGEPLVRKDLPQLAAYAVEKGMRAVISTNGTLITSKMARTLKEIGFLAIGTLEPNKELEAHRDPFEEIYFIMQGTGEMRVDDESKQVGPGDATWIPTGSLHSLFNNGNERCVVLVVASPWR